MGYEHIFHLCIWEFFMYIPCMTMLCLTFKSWNLAMHIIPAVGLYYRLVHYLSFLL
jgi:hypothetical protein